MVMTVKLVTFFDSTLGHRTVYLLSGRDSEGRGLEFVVADGTGAASEVRRRLVVDQYAGVAAEEAQLDKDLWVPQVLGSIPVSDDDLARFTARFRKQLRLVEHGAEVVTG